MDIDMASDSLGQGSDGQPVYLRDIWPTNEEVAATVRSAVTAGMFQHEYEHAFDGDKNWQGLQIPTGEIYRWDDARPISRSRRTLRTWRIRTRRYRICT